MIPAFWHRLTDELDQWQAGGNKARLWLRDDDAVEPTPALDRLADFSARFGAPVLLAIIPKGAREALAHWLAGAPLLLPAQHGYAHRNHAPAGSKPQELGLHRGLEAVLDDLVRGRDKMMRLFGQNLRPVLVPPWNRIDPALVPHLPGIGFEALSTFAEPGWNGAKKPKRFDSHVDLIDWKATRIGHEPEKAMDKLVAALALARGRNHAPAGILAHHLVHGERAWAFLESLGQVIATHPAARWISVDDLMCLEGPPDE